ncbi:MAG: response regulator transcription factor [Proteobacteria bacterium]|nr:response regulator transcription factor [Pseudomonadota bacterium]
MGRSGSPETAACALAPALIVEDDTHVQARLVRVLAEIGVDAASIHRAENIAVAQRLLDTYSFALVLIDIGLPDGSGIDLIGWMHRRESTLRVTAVVVSSFATQDLILQALHAGATGYLLKEREDAELTASLRSIERGGAPIDPFVARYILRVIATPLVARAVADAILPVVADENASVPLTRREEEILHLVAQGLISREIAERLSRSTLTIEGHIKSIFRKLHVSTRTQAIYQARSLGLLPR